MKLLIAVFSMFVCSNIFAAWAPSYLGSSNNSLIIEDATTESVYKGYMFSVSTSAVALGDGATFYYVLHMSSNTVKPDTIHLFFNVQASGAVRFDIFENTVMTSTGTAITPINLNRDSSRTSSVVITSAGTTISSPGTLLTQEMVPWSAGGPAFGTAGSTGAHWVLSDNKPYLVVVTNVSGGAVKASLTISYIEDYE